MNIESRMFRVRSDGLGGVAVEHKPSHHIVTISVSDFPASVAELAAMKEATFDRFCRELTK